MDISIDPAKQGVTLDNRGLDFADAGEVFAGRASTVQDIRQQYGEGRFITAGHPAGRCLVLVWTPRGTVRRIISMRQAHAAEEQAWFG